MVRDKKGQTLIFFIILLPILIGVCAFVIDYGIISYERNRLNNIIKLSYNENKDLDRLLKSNDITIYKKENVNNCIKVSYKRNSLFGSIIGIKEYKIKSTNCN